MPNFIVFSDDWGRHPSSCQHLFRQLLPRHHVQWVNTIGMRTPKFNLATVRRGLEKVRHWFRRRPAQEQQRQPRVLNPRMWPWFSSRFDRWLNRRLLVRHLNKVLADLPEPPIAVTTLPIVADLMDDLPVSHWVYYCVDDFGEWPGLDGTTMRRMEYGVVRRADAIIAVSDTLRERLAGMGRASHLLTHGVDLDFWSNATGAEIPQLGELQAPLIVFWGVIDRRMDLAFLQQLSADLQQGSIVLAGPEEDPDPALTQFRNVVRLGKLPFDALPTLARAASVLVMPYADLPVTRMMQPLKFKEYLATGKPAVVRDLPSTRPWRDCADLAATPREFSQAVRARLSGLPESQRLARRRLADESWSEKARMFERWALTHTRVTEECACG